VERNVLALIGVRSVSALLACLTLCLGCVADGGSETTARQTDVGAGPGEICVTSWDCALELDCVDGKCAAQECR
jgi:hypothetical protein